MAHPLAGPGTSYDPAILKLLGKAFDEVWDAIAESYASPQAAEVARLQLANFILSHAPTDGIRDVELIKYGALVALGHKEPASKSREHARADLVKEQM